MQRLMVSGPPRTIGEPRTRRPPSCRPSLDTMALCGGSSQLWVHSPARPSSSVHTPPPHPLPGSCPWATLGTKDAYTRQVCGSPVQGWTQARGQCRPRRAIWARIHQAQEPRASSGNGMQALSRCLPLTPKMPLDSSPYEAGWGVAARWTELTL